MKNKITLSLILLAALSFVKAQELPFLLSDFAVEKPQWKEYLHYQINPAQDTLYLSNGHHLQAGMLQADRYDTSGYWLGVDRWVWESPQVLRTYDHQGLETRTEWSLSGNCLAADYQKAGNYYSCKFEYSDSLISRISISEDEVLEEYVFVYQGKQNRLNKVKHYKNGEELGEIRMTYNSAGELMMEEYWQSGNLNLLATYGYEEGVLQTIALMNLGSGKGQLKEQHFYAYTDDGMRFEESHYYLTTNGEDSLVEHRTFDSENRIVKRLTIHHDQKLRKDIEVYSYPVDASTEIEILSLHAEKR